MNPLVEESILLQVEDITKVFPGVRALYRVSFDLLRGEVHALLGENGAGKSTLIKILAGAYVPDSGRIFVEGQEVHILHPKQGEELGISVIYQEFSLVPYLSVAENIFLGREPLRKRGIKIIDWKRMYEEARILLERLGSEIHPKTPVRDLSVAEQQMVEIVKALSLNAKIIVMDEPTAALNSQEITHLFRMIDQIRREGTGIVYISHRLEEVFEIGDRITVLRDGCCVGTVPAKGTETDTLIQMMVGRKLEAMFPWERRERGEPILSIEGFTREGVFHDIDLKVHQNEILGLAGLVGSGRTELVRAIFGAYPVDKGSITIQGEKGVPKSPSAAISKGIGFLPADRKREGLILCLSVLQNMTIASLLNFVRRGFIRLKEEERVARDYKDKLGIKVPTLKREVLYLSGGNQQKVMLAKWLCSKARVIVFDEPTRGVDVGAKFEIHRLMVDLAKQGKGIIMISSELPEILGMSDRVLVFRRGRISAEFSREEATKERVLQQMLVGQAGKVNGRNG